MRDFDESPEPAPYPAIQLADFIVDRSTKATIETLLSAAFLLAEHITKQPTEAHDDRLREISRRILALRQSGVYGDEELLLARRLALGFAEKHFGVDDADGDDEVFTPAADYFQNIPPIPKVSPPIVSNPGQSLPFVDLVAANVFEHLCHDLISGWNHQKLAYVYGKRGQKQEGVDIVVLPGPDEVQRRAYYQCKHYVRFTLPNLRAAIKKFEGGKNARRSRTFVLLTACDHVDPEAIEHFQNERYRLYNKYGVVASLLTAKRLASDLSVRKDIVRHYFGEYWYDRVFVPDNETPEPIAQSVDVIEGAQLHNGLGDAIFPDDLSVRSEDGWFTVANRRVHLNVSCLGTDASHSGSTAALTIRYLNGMQVGFGPEDIRRAFRDTRFGSVEERSFFRSQFILDGETKATIQFGNARLYARIDVAEDLCEVIDESADLLIAKLREFDERFDTKGFQIVYRGWHRVGTMFELGFVDEFLWECLQGFTDSNASEIDGLVVQSRGSARIRVYTGEIAGARTYVEFAAEETGENKDLRILWLAPPVGVVPAESEGWWGAGRSLAWFADVLIPAALDWRIRQAIDSAPHPLLRLFQKGNEGVLRMPSKHVYTPRKAYLEPLLSNAASRQELALVVSVLQRFVTGGERVWGGDSRGRVNSALVAALHRAKLSDGNSSYIRTKLFGAGPPMTQADVMSAVERHLADGAPISDGEVDDLIRSLKEILEKSDCELPANEVNEIGALLIPFARRHDAELMLDLHTPQVG